MNESGWKLLFPSRTMREAVQASGRVLTDMEKAALLYHWDEIGTRWRKLLYVLRDNTKDSVLQRQLAEYLSREEKAYALFPNNEDGKHIFDLLQGKEKARHYPQYEIALQQGRKTGKPFCINRRDQGSGYDAISNALRAGYPNRVVAQLWFNEKGTPVSFRSIEIPMAYENPEDLRLNRFELRYVPLPYPFAPGDVVKNLKTGNLGIVQSTQKDIERQTHREARFLDWSANDVQLLTTDDQNLYDTRRVSSIYLQRGPQTIAACKSREEEVAVYTSKMYMDGYTPQTVRDVLKYHKG